MDYCGISYKIGSSLRHNRQNYSNFQEPSFFVLETQITHYPQYQYCQQQYKSLPMQQSYNHIHIPPKNLGYNSYPQFPKSILKTQYEYSPPKVSQFCEA